MSDGETAGALWGTDHEKLDAPASLAVGPHAAIAISRGRFKKVYRYVDANEDMVAAVAGPRATLLVCADGHNGATSAAVATQEVLAAMGDDPPASLDDGEWVALFARVNEAVLARKGVGSLQPASNTVLVVALASPGHLSWATIGDGAIVVGRPGAQRARQVNKEAMRFVGYPMNKRSLKSTVQHGATRLDEGEWVVAVTDGLSEFISPLRPADVVPRVLGSVPAPVTAEAAALALIETACSAGAGDNVAVAVVAPG